MQQVMPANSPAAEYFRANVRKIIEDREITITEMADGLEMSRPGLSRILSGHEAVTISRAEKIADYLEVSLPSLLMPLSKKIRQPA